MSIQTSLPIFRRQTVKRIAHIFTDIGVPVLVEGEAAGGVLDEKVEEPDFVVFELGEFFRDDVGDEVGAAGFRREGEGLLKPAHGVCLRLGRWEGTGGRWTAGAGRKERLKGRRVEVGAEQAEGQKKGCEQEVKGVGKEGYDEDGEEDKCVP